MSGLRIALATTEFAGESNADGGLAAYTGRTAAALAALGHLPQVLVCSTRDADERCDGIPVRRVDVRLPPHLRVLDRASLHRAAVPIGVAWTALRMRAALLDLHRRAAFAVAHYTNLGALALRRPPLPLLVRLSSHRGLYRFAGDVYSRGWHGAVQHRLELLALRAAEVLIAPSPTIAAATAEDTGRRIAVLDNPFPPIADAVIGALPPALQGRRYVLFPATLAPLKGTRDLAAILPDLLHDPDLVVAIAGKEPPGGDEIRRMRAAAGSAGDRLVHLGLLPRPALWAAMRTARAVMIPSRSDNMPNAGLEALALGALVVATDASGLGRHIVDGRSGLLCPAADPAALLTTLRRALSCSRDEADAMRAAARAAMDRLRPEATVGRLVAAYRLAIRRFGQRRRG